MSRMARVTGLLGLARRAGALAAGTAAVRQAVRGGQARAVLLARDASPVQLDKIERTLHERSIPVARVGSQVGLGAAVGLAPLSAVAVTDPSLAEQVLAALGGDLLLEESVPAEG